MFSEKSPWIEQYFTPASPADPRVPNRPGCSLYHCSWLVRCPSFPLLVREKVGRALETGADADARVLKPALWVRKVVDTCKTQSKNLESTRTTACGTSVRKRCPGMVPKGKKPKGSAAQPASKEAGQEPLRQIPTVSCNPHSGCGRGGGHVAKTTVPELVSLELA